jgi:hypothetical protein
MRQRVLEQTAIAEPVLQRGLEIREFVTQPHHLAARELCLVAIDDARSLVRLVLPH